jgi:hypothetical protein
MFCLSFSQQRHQRGEGEERESVGMAAGRDFRRRRYASPSVTDA